MPSGEIANEACDCRAYANDPDRITEFSAFNDDVTSQTMGTTYSSDDDLHRCRLFHCDSWGMMRLDKMPDTAHGPQPRQSGTTAHIVKGLAIQ